MNQNLMSNEQDNKVEDFTRFFEDKNYIKLKNYLFNYLNRKRLVKFYSGKYLKGDKYCDLGSGISPVSPDLKKTTFIDISKPALKILQKKGYKTIYGSITEIPIDKEQFDMVFCSEVLEHVKDYRKAINEISRILKTEGKALITVPCWMKYWNTDDEFVGHYLRFNPEKMKEDIENSGMKLIEKKNLGSFIERRITIFLVRNFKKNKKINNFMIYPYILANYFLSWLVTVSSFLTSENKSSIIMFVCEKSR